ncbi:AAA family ATPase [Arsenophonus nasoniae]|uniref:AAA domain protein n=2 Tax=Arsenophonus nasoniae TaxID=638 RepID=A0A4V1BWI1_9GAMM|nr:AAA family ATPase [Arsenophonus nasoniae]QBY42273.1 AAA domain protein [Arsenophonus nasoniae]WGM05091.1 AAA family ATPase [Arsenophonus nasoniae]WGM06424.1 AAA family ATPase [Arsenophonus nasoniae]WGM10103.1 AAA family ATPase [Arsenophonus nasoniae]WGM11359.1 AAA family ATPase [Arsenophonus nasoniae]
MLKLKTLLQQHNLTQAALARALDLSEATLAQIVNHHQWPKQDTDTLKHRIRAWLRDQGIAADDCFDGVTSGGKEKRPLPSNEEDTMLLKKQVLLPATKKHFGLFRAPFDDNAVQGHDDVFLTPESRYVREALYQTARYGGFIAVIGESGSGKSTLRRDLTDRIYRENAPVVVIEPYVLAMEDNDHQGKTLKAASLAEAIVHTLAPLEKLKRSPEARFRQLHRLLKDSSRAGYSHVLVIEEAHSLPIPTLKHLKRFFELEDGFKKLLSIVLLGQPELGDKLSERLLAVREVVQRCEVIDLPPLDDHLADFLDFKFKRVGGDLGNVLGPDAIPALRQRLSWLRPKKDTPVSLLYPLAIGNLVTAAMNLAAQNAIPVIDANIIHSVH